MRETVSTSLCSGPPNARTGLAVTYNNLPLYHFSGDKRPATSTVKGSATLVGGGHGRQPHQEG